MILDFIINQRLNGLPIDLYLSNYGLNFIFFRFPFEMLYNKRSRNSYRVILDTPNITFLKPNSPLGSLNNINDFHYYPNKLLSSVVIKTLSFRVTKLISYRATELLDRGDVYG